MIEESLVSRWMDIIKKSQLFDEEYYLSTYPDVKESGIDPVRHYVRNGVREGRNPSKDFNTREYIESNPELLKMKSNPLVHYIMRKYPEVYAQVLGLDERLRSKSKVILEKEKDLIKVIRDGAFFDTDFYLNQIDLEEDNLLPDLLAHFYEKGSEAYKSPVQWFDIQTYADNSKDVVDAGFNPYLHFLEYGYQENREFSPLIELSEAKSLLANSKNKWVYFESLNKYIKRRNIKSVKLTSDKVDGRIESLEDGVVIGWVVRKNHSDRVANFVLSIGNEENYLIKNDLKRDDLKKKGISNNGIGGFKVDTGLKLLPTDRFKVYLLENSDTLIANNIESVSEDKDSSKSDTFVSELNVNNEYIRNNKLKFNIEAFDQKNIKGWMVALNNKNLVLEFELYINDLFFCKFKADSIRKDLKRLGLSAGLGGISFSIAETVGNILFNKPKNKVSVYSSSKDLVFEYIVNKSHIMTVTHPLNVTPVGETAVIVPIYNAYEDVLTCIERLESYTPRGTEVLLINDASSDERIRPLLENINSEKLNFKVIHNSENLGFTRTVNKGIGLCPSKNVILLNSDARVTPRWLEGMMYAASTDSNIATVTAMSDRAGAFSAPNIGNENDLPCGVHEEDYASAFRRYSAGIYPTVPTGNGFCMFIRRRCIDELGGLDAEAFPRGYGEENDFSMRARNNGWRNIIDDRTYIFHDRSKSFGGEKTALMKAGRKVIDERYPDYGKAIQFYSQNPLMSTIRYRARLALKNVTDKNFRPRALYVISTLTGGTPQTNRDLMMALYDTVEPWLLHCNSETMTLYKVGEEEDTIIEQYQLTQPIDPYIHKSTEYDNVVRQWLLEHDFTLVHIRHLVWHSINLPKVVKETGAKAIMSLHDYYVASPDVKLIDTYNDPNSKVHKLAPLWMNYETPDNREGWLQKWRHMFTQALNYCDSFVTTSESAKDTILKYLDLDSTIPFAVINHGRDFDIFREPNVNNTFEDRIRILVPGNIDKNKGLDVINELVALDTEDKLEIHILGNCSEVFDPDKVINHGIYDRKDFTKLVAEINPHISAVFSIWNETWCHTLTESWASGVPTLAFDFETIASRLKQTQAGWIVGLGDTPQLYNSIINEFTDQDEYAQKLENVRLWQQGLGSINNNRYMSIQYLNLYKNALYGWNKPLKEVCGVVVPSNKNLVEANGSSYVRVWQKTENSLDRKVSYLRLRPDQLVIGVQTGRIEKSIIQRNVLSVAQWQMIKPYVLKGSFNYIYEIDDDLLNVPADKDTKGYYAQYRSTLVELLTHASLITVTNNALKTKFEQFNRNITIIPNTLNPKYWRSFQKSQLDKDSNTLLYFGSYTHLADLDIIIPALDKVYETNKAFKLKLIGVSQTAINKPWVEQVQIPEPNKEYPQFVDFLQAQAFNCVAGIAPLEDKAFNEYKSDLKIKEYLGLGLPVLASNTSTYAKFKDHSYVELVDDNEWYEAIVAFLNDTSSLDSYTLEDDLLFDENNFDKIISHLS